MSIHALYRFFGTDGALLYIGITCNPGNRWASHEERPWWHTVARIALETFPDRDSVLRAEAAAIAAERPLYNVKHKGNGNGDARPPAVQDKRVAPFSEGDVVALGLDDGKCPVGLITAMDEEWVRLDLMSWWDGCFGMSTAVLRRDEIRRVMVARRVSNEECKATRHCVNFGRQGSKCFDTNPLGDFNTKWRAEHGDPRAIAYLASEAKARA